MLTRVMAILIWLAETPWSEPGGDTQPLPPAAAAVVACVLLPLAAVVVVTAPVAALGALLAEPAFPALAGPAAAWLPAAPATVVVVAGCDSAPAPAPGAGVVGAPVLTPTPCPS